MPDRFDGFLGMLTKHLEGAAGAPDAQQTDIDLLVDLGFVQKGALAGPSFAEVMAGIDWTKVKSATDEARKDQERRSQKYGIAIKDGGHLAKPSEWKDVPEEKWGDPVNWKLPMPDKGHADNAASRLAQETFRKEYSADELKKIDSRVKDVQKSYQGDKAAFADATARAEYSGIAVKGFTHQPTDGVDVLEPTAWADFSNHMFPISTRDEVDASMAAWNAMKALGASNPYSEMEQRLIEQAITMADHHTKAADRSGSQDDQSSGAQGQNGDMATCPECGKPVPKGTVTCPHCGSKIGGTDNAADENAAKAYDAEVDRMALALKAAFRSKKDDEIDAATLFALDLSQKAGAQHTTPERNSIQGIHDHAMYLGANCNDVNVPDENGQKSVRNKGVTGAGSATGASSQNNGAMSDSLTAHLLAQQVTELTAEVARLKAAGSSNGDASELAKAKEASLAQEQEAERLRGEIAGMKDTNDRLLTELRQKSADADEATRRAHAAQVPLEARKKVSVGSPEYVPAVPASGPRTFMDQYRADE